MTTETRKDTVVKPMEVRDIVGDFGRYQLLVLLVAGISTATTGSIAVIMELLAPSVTMYWNWEGSNPNKTRFQSAHCKMEDVLIHTNSSPDFNFTSTLIYETPYSNRALTQDMNLVCERSWIISFAKTVLMVGQLFSSALIPLSERFGRRRFVLIFSALFALVNLCMAFSGDIVWFLVLYFFAGVCSLVPLTLLYGQGVEVIPAEKIPYFGAVLNIGILLGQFLVVAAAWILKDWVYLQLFHTAFLALSALLCWYILDSPVWLAVRGKYEEARTNLIKIIQKNGRDPKLQSDKIVRWLEEMKVRCEVQSKAEKGTFKDLFKNKLITMYTLAFTFNQNSVNFVYYGLVLNVESFGSGLFMDFTLAICFSIGAMVICTLCLVRTSTKNILIFCVISETIVCGMYPILYDIPVARTVLSVLSRVFICPAFSVNYIYMNEIYPTSVRSAIIGFVMAFSRPITALSSFTKELGENTAIYVPFILFAILGLSTAINVKFLPDTKRRPLIHTVDELVARRNEKRKDTVYTISTKL